MKNLQKNVKQLRYGLTSFNMLAYLLCNTITFGLGCLFFKKIDLLSSVHHVSLFYGSDIDRYMPVIVLFITFLLTLLSLIPNGFLLNQIFRLKENKKEIKLPIKILKGLLATILCVFFVIMNVYYYIEIPEFTYAWEKTETGWALTDEYVDIRDVRREEGFIIQEEVKKVIGTIFQDMTENLDT